MIDREASASIATIGLLAWPAATIVHGLLEN